MAQASSRMDLVSISNLSFVSPSYFTEEIYMATCSYQAKKDDEISFDIGVNVQVIEKTLDGWWRVM